MNALKIENQGVYTTSGGNNSLVLGSSMGLILAGGAGLTFALRRSR